MLPDPGRTGRTHRPFDTLRPGGIVQPPTRRRAPASLLNRIESELAPVKRRLPEWFKVPFPGGEDYADLKQRVRAAGLHTVCEEAACPNIGECWGHSHTATFMILGDICTRACAYCNVTTGRPHGLDTSEPARVARAVKDLGLRYAVITSVDRDDLPDGGAAIFADTVREIHAAVPDCKVEVLVPDFQGSRDALRQVMDAGPQVLNHNIETVRRVFRTVRPKGDYDLSLQLLRRAREMHPETPTKSGLMVGLGETADEVSETMQDLRDAGCALLTIGQYLSPSPKHHPVSRFYEPEEFEELAAQGLRMGFTHVASGPLVRSSYHAAEQHASASRSS